jgi:hypothetical protein
MPVCSQAQCARQATHLAHIELTVNDRAQEYALALCDVCAGRMAALQSSAQESIDPVRFWWGERPRSLAAAPL